MAKATFGAGCFWSVQTAFDRIAGVVSTTVGYAGGHTAHPTYKDVCSGQTGHAEVVEVEYDPERVSYDRLLDTFWRSHDPTQLNRQGPDIGTQYRSVIFVHSPDQETAARHALDTLAQSNRFQRPIVTAIEPAGPFFSAEEYHQKYLEKRGQALCSA